MEKAAVYSDNYFRDEVEGLSALRIQIIPSSRIIGAPVESGEVSFDNKVIDPSKVVVRGNVVIGSEWSDYAVQTIKRMMENRDYQFYSVCDGKQFMDNLILESAPSTREADEFDYLKYELTFKQARIVQKTNEGSGEHSNILRGGFSSGVGV